MKRNAIVRGVTAALALALVMAAPLAAELKVVYPQIEERAGDDYGFKVLKLALEKSGVPFTLSISPTKMNQERARAYMQDGSISILDFGTSADYEKQFQAVYFPIDRGLSGYRLFIINKTQAADFAAIKTVKDLTKKVAGQGPGWADIKIIEAAGIKVTTGPFENLFGMVDLKRFDFFPLGVEEIYGLLDRYKASAPNSIVEEKLVFHYPFGRLFFVKKDNKELADAVLAGLKKAFADGSFQKLLDDNNVFKTALAKANLKTRTLLEVDNPNLTAEFKKIPAEYFYKP